MQPPGFVDDSYTLQEDEDTFEQLVDSFEQQFDLVPDTPRGRRSLENPATPPLSPRSPKTPWAPAVSSTTPADPPSPSSASRMLPMTKTKSNWIGHGGTEDLSNDLVRVSNDDLQEAALRGDLGLIRRLCFAGASVNAPIRPESEDEYMSLLHILASKPELPNGPRIMQEVILRKANLNVRSSLGTTPLSRACLTKNIGAVEVLLEAKADVSPLDDYGRKAVLYALLPPPGHQRTEQNQAQQEQQVDELVHMLADNSASLDDGGDVSPIVHAVRQQDLAAVKSLLACGAIADGLHDALDKGSMTIFIELINAEANPFLKDEQGKSVMDVALGKGLGEITTLLRDYIGDLQRKQHPHLKTLEDQMEEEAREIEAMANGMQQRRSWTRKFSWRNKSATTIDSGAATNESCLHRLRSSCRALNRTKFFQSVMFAALLMALFVPDLWVLADMTSTDVLDGLLVTIFVLFIFEFLVQVVGFWRSYNLTFFFWMDLIGILSVPLDHSIIIGAMEGSSALDSAIVMRAARMAKLGARAGRFTKLLKLLRFLPGMKNIDDGGTAKVISGCLNRALSTRVSCLIIVMVLLMPIFELVTFPENDYSMKLWLGEISDAAALDPLGVLHAFQVADRAGVPPTEGFGGGSIEQTLMDCQNFFADKSYGPFQISYLDSAGDVAVGPIRLMKRMPARRRNRISIKSEDGLVRGDFNFEVPNQIEALSTCLLMIFIIVAMMGSAMLLANSVSAIVLVPLEELFHKVHKVAANIFSTVNEAVSARTKNKGAAQSDGAQQEEDMEGEGDAFGHETQLLEKVLAKLQTLSKITLEKSPLDSELFEKMGDDDRAVIQGYGGTDPLESYAANFASEKEDEAQLEELYDLIDAQLEEADITREYAMDWELDVRDLDDPARHRLVLSILMLHHGSQDVGSSDHEVWMNRCSTFVDDSAKGYDEKVIFHNWAHAVDVTFTMSQLLRIFLAEKFLTATERFALVVASVCHDIGHQGLNSHFLVESRHELAMRYNDRSPLENFHCVKLFNITSQSRTAIFDHMPKMQKIMARQVIVEAILCTDVQFHAAMVKELQTIRDLSADLFDASEDLFNASPADYPSPEVIEYLRRTDVRQLMKRSLLHLCDVAQPLKSFFIAEAWANLMMEELFVQGDRERELGMPIQPLNDRDKVDIAFTQVRWIEFIVAPLAVSMSKMMPPMNPVMDLLFENMDKWFNRWVDDAEEQPPLEEQTVILQRLQKLQSKYRAPHNDVPSSPKR